MLLVMIITNSVSKRSHLTTLVRVNSVDGVAVKNVCLICQMPFDCVEHKQYCFSNMVISMF